ncbi:tyrosine-type recombinase/integrase [Dokdonella fugitiva]|jgi:integrase|uniref:Site-specific recombinase XerD n=1 Tax=Dokdonella fugitiva TaxID=328517 RepID=A0A4R2I072_9GAMM|nr:site-specific integrase [Dokdonella fugitiva]MBA8885603.1 integrase [Dokdonella fugitiva]TCO36829.1 site-specific recombinase XerD [Dokdonella fugitiva]
MASIQERNGRWRAFVRRKGESVSESFLTKSAAKEWARRVESQIDRGEFRSAQASSVTLATVIDDYEKELRASNRRSKTKLSAYRMLRQGLGALSVVALTADDVLTHVRRRRATGTGPATLNMEIGFLDELLTYARMKLPVGNPVADARPMLRRLHLIAKPKERTRRPTALELERLRDYWRFPRGKELPMTAIMDFAIATSMRLGEIVRLRWADIDHEKKLALIRDSKHPTDKIGNDLWIPLLGDSWDILLRQPRGELVFPFHRDAISRAFLRACKACAIDDLHFHDLRHEGASRLFEAGLQIQQVALVTRHRDWKSLKRYTNLKPEALHELLRK